MSRIASRSRFMDWSRSSMMRSTCTDMASAPPVLLDELRFEPLGLRRHDPQRGLAAAAATCGPRPTLAMFQCRWLRRFHAASLGVLRRPLRLGQRVPDVLQGLPELAEPRHRPPVGPPLRPPARRLHRAEPRVEVATAQTPFRIATCASRSPSATPARHACSVATGEVPARPAAPLPLQPAHQPAHPGDRLPPPVPSLLSITHPLRQKLRQQLRSRRCRRTRRTPRPRSTPRTPGHHPRSGTNPGNTRTRRTGHTPPIPNTSHMPPRSPPVFGMGHPTRPFMIC